MGYKIIKRKEMRLKNKELAVNPRYIRIQDTKNREWHHVNVYHVIAVTETKAPKSAQHWDAGSPERSGCVVVKLSDGTQYETDTYNAEQIIQRLTKANTEWSRVIDKLDLMG